jgi:RNA polymerase sigma-70 factor, ECF subfamily
MLHTYFLGARSPSRDIVASADSSQWLDTLFRESADDLSRYFTRRHNATDLVPDLVQETFLQMTRSVQDGRPLQCARGYLFGIARHLSQAAWSRTAQNPTVPLDDHLHAIPAPMHDDRIDAARETIAALPALQREVLELRFIQNLSYQEIAEALAIPLGTVRSRLHHAVAEVRQRLAQEHPTPPSAHEH